MPNMGNRRRSAPKKSTQKPGGAKKPSRKRKPAKKEKPPSEPNDNYGWRAESDHWFKMSDRGLPVPVKWFLKAFGVGASTFNTWQADEDGLRAIQPGTKKEYVFLRDASRYLDGLK